MTTTTVLSLSLPAGPVDVTLDDRGAGPVVLLLHGGAGPASVAAFAERLARAVPARVLTPTHPGFGGTPRPEALDSIGGLAALYTALLDRLGVSDVVVVGNSIGGWVAAEMALLHSPRVRRVALVDAVGIAVGGHPVVDVFPLTLPELAQLSYHDPKKFTLDPATFTDQQRAGMAANRAALAVYGGSMSDPGLRERLAGVDVPTLVLWGEADRVADVDYGRAYAAAIPRARFEVLPATGHVPQIETPEQLARALGVFIAGLLIAALVVAGGGQHAGQQPPEGLELRGRQRRERGGQHAVDDPLSGAPQRAPTLGERVAHGAARARQTLDEAAVDHARGERAKALVTLEREHGQVVQRRLRVLVEVAQRVPLHERDVQLGQGGVGGAVVAHLQPLHRQPDRA